MTELQTLIFPYSRITASNKIYDQVHMDARFPVWSQTRGDVMFDSVIILICEEVKDE